MGTFKWHRTEIKRRIERWGTERCEPVEPAPTKKSSTSKKAKKFAAPASSRATSTAATGRSSGPASSGGADHDRVPVARSLPERGRKMLAATLAAKEAEIEGLLDRAAQLMVEVKDMRRRLQRR